MPSDCSETDGCGNPFVTSLCSGSVGEEVEADVGGLVDAGGLSGLRADETQVKSEKIERFIDLADLSDLPLSTLVLLRRLLESTSFPLPSVRSTPSWDSDFSSSGRCLCLSALSTTVTVHPWLSASVLVELAG